MLQHPYFLDDLETVWIISMKNVWAHEGEHWHDIEEDGIWSQASQVSDQE